jgi:hypothetical protein
MKIFKDGASVVGKPLSILLKKIHETKKNPRSMESCKNNTFAQERKQKSKQWQLACEIFECCLCGAFRLDVVTRQTRRHSPDSPTLAKGHFREKCDSPC